MKLWNVGIFSAVAFALPLAAQAKKPGSVPGTPDLAGAGIVVKSKSNATTSTINNLTLLIDNNGSGDAANSRVEFYLSDDTTLTTTPDELTSVTDTLIHSQSVGTVKANRTKKRTLGGGLLKKAGATTNQHVIAVLDSTNLLEESDETNNVFVSDPLP